jgi:RNA polymerase sigma factor (sigma-70 family)
MALRPECLLRQFRWLASRPAPEQNSDSALLGRFVRDRDEDAFTALVERHFGLVLGVCRRVLGDVHAAEDAAQAAFLLLARKAASIRRPEALSAWLYGAARRLAWRCRRAEARRRLREIRAAAVRPPADPLEELTARELLLLLDDELQRLPEVYRLPILLCCLEGHDQAEAARVLAWTPGSLKGRLERGRARLYTRLARRGLTLPAALLALQAVRAGAPVGLTRAAAAFAARAPVTEGVSPAVVALAQGGLQVMLLSRLKVMLVVVAAVGLAGTGVGWLATGSSRGGPAATAAAPVTRPQAPATPHEEKKDNKHADAIPKARAELRRVTLEAEKLDHDLTKQVIQARQQMVELEERLHQTGTVLPAEIGAQQAALLKEAERRRAWMHQIEGSSVKGRNDPGFAKAQKEFEQVQEHLADLQKKAAAVQRKLSAQRLELRREMVRQEEEIRLLERKRDAVREQTERARQEAAERLRRLEGGPAMALPALPVRELMRRLDAIQRELAELRREVQRRRPER